MPIAPIPCRFKDVIFKYVPEHEFPKLYKERKIAYVLAGAETDDSGTKWIPCLVRDADQEKTNKKPLPRDDSAPWGRCPVCREPLVFNPDIRVGDDYQLDCRCGYGTLSE